MTDKLRAVFYARVSTEEERQINALEKQIEENRNVIKEKGWLLVDEYIDEGRTGTTTRQRTEYNRLLDDLSTDKFDIVVIKSQDRLQRNTKDWYIFTDKLVVNNKKLFMYIENSFYTPDNALITGIKAILAEEYSRELSKKINNANNNRIERARQGQTVPAFGNCYGYKSENGNVTILESEAEIVRLIFKLYLEGKGGRTIRRELTTMGILNRKGTEFDENTILNIIKNERYIGTIVTNMYHKDFYSKKLTKKPREEWVRVENAVPPIISKEDFEKAQDILNNHRIEHGTGKRVATFGKKTGSHPLSGKIYCGLCGKIFWKKTRTDNGRIIWQCSTYTRRGRKTGRRYAEIDSDDIDSEKGCDNAPVYSDVLTEVLKALSEEFEINIEEVKKDMLKWLNSLLKTLENDDKGKDLSRELERLERQKNKLTEAYLDEIISKEDYKVKYKDIEDKINRKKQELPQNVNSDIQDIKNVIENIDSQLEEWLKINELELANDKLEFLMSHIEKVTVTKDKIELKLDLLENVLVTDKNSFLYVKESRRFFIHTEKRYLVPANGNLLEVVLIV